MPDYHFSNFPTLLQNVDVLCHCEFLQISVADELQYWDCLDCAFQFSIETVVHLNLRFININFRLLLFLKCTTHFQKHKPPPHHANQAFVKYLCLLLENANEQYVQDVLLFSPRSCGAFQRCGVSQIIISSTCGSSEDLFTRAPMVICAIQ